MGEYPEDWDEIALEVKAAAGFKCEHCGHQNDRSTGHVLTVHHLDADPANNDLSNLVALCQRCHLRFQNVDLSPQGWIWGPPEWLARRLPP